MANGSTISHSGGRARGGGPYTPPTVVHSRTLAELLDGLRTIPLSQVKRLQPPELFERGIPSEASPTLYFSGNLELLKRRNVAIVGSRAASPEGQQRARQLARALAERNVTVTSGLAEGIDVAAHTAAIEARGATIAVIGTPVNKAYPAAHARLQEEIWREHLLISPFAVGTPTFRSSFPHRNKIMAALTDATVIIEASDSSGTLHQAAECLRIGRWLFIAQNIVNRVDVTWPSSFLQSAAQGKRVRVLGSLDDLLSTLDA